MRLPPGRFTIRGLMIVVGVIAGLLALPVQLSVIALAMSLPVLAVLYARWLYAHGLLRIAGFCFWTPAISINALYAALCTFPGFHLIMLIGAWFVFALPTIAGFGTAWAGLIGGGDGDRQAPTSRAWLSVFALTLMPLATAWTAWPFQVRFLMARPDLERLADRVTAGRAMTYPQEAGLFRIAGSAFDPASGNVGLMIDTNPSGPSGFVRNRVRHGGPFGCYRPFRGDWYHLDLLGGWCYHEED